MNTKPPPPRPSSVSGERYDVIFAGGGMVGLTLAVALAGQGLRCAVVDREDPDLVILDMMMPKRSGFLVLEWLRRTRRVPSVCWAVSYFSIRKNTLAMRVQAFVFFPSSSIPFLWEMNIGTRVPSLLV